jgi:hypothetical protein
MSDVAHDEGTIELSAPMKRGAEGSMTKETRVVDFCQVPFARIYK